MRSRATDGGACGSGTIRDRSTPYNFAPAAGGTEDIRARSTSASAVLWGARCWALAQPVPHACS